MEIVHKKSFDVVGFKIETDWSNLFYEAPRLREKLFERIGEIKNRIDNKCFEISLSKQDDVYIHLVCVEVSEILDRLPEGMIGLTIPEQTYAFCKHNNA